MSNLNQPQTGFIMNKQDRINYAKELKDNPLFNELFKELDQQIKERLQDADLRDEKELKAIAATAQVIDSINGFIRTELNNELLDKVNNG